VRKWPKPATAWSTNPVKNAELVVQVSLPVAYRKVCRQRKLSPGGELFVTLKEYQVENQQPLISPEDIQRLKRKIRKAGPLRVAIYSLTILLVLGLISYGATATTMLVHTRREVVAIQGESVDLQGQNSDLQSQLSDLQSKNDDLSGQVQGLQNQVDDLNSQADSSSSVAIPAPKVPTIAATCGASPIFAQTGQSESAYHTCLQGWYSKYLPGVSCGAMCGL
jgi:cell division protein FtsL